MKTWIAIAIAAAVGILCFFLGAKFGGSVTASSANTDETAN